MSIIDDLAALRKAHGLTQASLAHKAGLARVTITKIETGVVDPQLSTLQACARALDVEFMAVPRHLKAELQAFVQSGGRLLAQPPGTSAPPSIVDRVLDRP